MANIADTQSREQMLATQMLAICVQTPGVGGDTPDAFSNGQVLGLPVMLWGMPGVAKTAKVKQIARTLQWSVEKYVGDEKKTLMMPNPTTGEMAKSHPWTLVTVLASIRQPEDFLGIPVPNISEVDSWHADMRHAREKLARLPADSPQRRTWEDDIAKLQKDRPTTAVQYYPAEWVRQLQRAGYVRPVLVKDNPLLSKVGQGPCSILFLDEFTTAIDPVQAAMLRVVHERVVGDEQLPANTAMVAAANPPAMSPGGTGLTMPVANRFLHLNWAPPTPEQWGAWLEGHGQESYAIPRIDLELFEHYYDALRPQVAQYVQEVLQDGRSMLFRAPPQGAAEKMEQAMEDFDPSVYAWASPRSWELALRARAGALATVWDGDDQSGADWIRMEWGERLVCAAVGEEACNHFNRWYTDQEYVPPLVFINEPGKFKHNPKKADRTTTEFGVVWNYIKRTYGADPDTGRKGLRRLVDEVSSIDGGPTLIAPVIEDIKAWQIGSEIRDPRLEEDINEFLFPTLKQLEPSLQI